MRAEGPLRGANCAPSGGSERSERGGPSPEHEFGLHAAGFDARGKRCLDDAQSRFTLHIIKELTTITGLPDRLRVSLAREQVPIKPAVQPTEEFIVPVSRILNRQDSH